MSDNHDDMRRAMELGIPFASVCMTFPAPAYFDPDWQLRMAQDHWFLATLKTTSPNRMPITWNTDLMRRHGELRLPWCLKDDNRASPMIRPEWRLPKTEESIPNSTVVMHMAADGVTIDDAGCADVFGPTTVWEIEARRRATDAYVKALQALCPSPAWYTDNDNNEADMLKSPGMGTNLVPNNTTTDLVEKSKWPDPNTVLYKWKPREMVRKCNLRLDAWIMANGGYGADPDLFYPTFRDLHNGKYAAYDRAFVEASPDGWKNRYTEGYSAWRGPGWNAQQFVYDAIGPGMHLATAFDAVGPSIYVKPKDTLLSINPNGDVSAAQSIWEWTRNRNQRAYRSVWMSIGGDGALNGALTGVHEVVDPSVFEALSAFALWRYRANNGGVALNLRYWDNWNTLRGELLFGNPNEQPARNETLVQKADRERRIANAVRRYAALDSLGRPELKVATIEDYVQAMVRAVDRINADETLREFWQKGETVPARYPNGTKAPFVLVKLGAEYLVYAFTPCLLGDVTLSTPAGDVRVSFGGKPSAYRIGKPPSGGLEWSDVP